MDESLIQGNTEKELLTSFLQLFTTEQGDGVNIDNLIAEIGMFYQADRAYIFERRGNKDFVDNTYEWCRKGITSEIANLKDIPIELMTPWFEEFQKNGAFLLHNNEEYKKTSPIIAEILEPQGIDCLIAAPITLNGVILGFLGVDNPKINEDKLFLLTVITASLYKEIVYIREAKLIKNLRKAKSTVSDIRKTLESSGVGIWTVTGYDTPEPKLHANAMMLELLGIKDVDIDSVDAYRYWISGIEDKDFHLVEEFVQEMNEGKPSEITVQWNHPEKGKVYVRCSGVLAESNDRGRVFTGMYSDITERVRKEQEYTEQLELANKSKTVFLNNMSHDIRTPLNAILGFTKLMEGKLDNPEVMKDYLTKIEKSGEYLLSIVNNVLEIARIDSGKEEVDEVYTDLTAEDCSVYPLLENEINKKNLTFTCNMNITHKYVFADMSKIREITMNLMSNAIKYTSSGGKIHLQFDEVPCEKEGYATYINTISDTGIGMSDDFKNHIFESFSRERNTTDSRILGTGLGMSIVKRLVDLLGGTIEVESEPGKGTTFRVVMTHKLVDNPNEFLEVIKATATEQVDLTNKRILLAEDNDLNAEIAVTILEGYGTIVDRVADGIECIHKINKNASDYYDFVLMDIQMPNMNGYDATKLIRKLADPVKAGIPIIAMTANAFEEEKRHVAEVGMNGHIAKPINIESMLKTLTNVLNNSKR